jgi:hypothetical protein
MTLNLSHNRIVKIENLKDIVSLKNIDLSHNRLPNKESLEGLTERLTLTSIDISNNLIEYSEDLLSFLFSMQHILAFYLKGNPCVRSITQYRRNVIAGF